MRRMCVPSILLLALASWAVVGEAAGPPSFRAAVEADWLLQDQVRTGKRLKVTRHVTTRQDALGAVDGELTGKWAFHTGLDNPPWWHVDLGSKEALDRVVVNASPVVTTELTGGTTTVDLGTWPAASALWIAAANPTSSASSSRRRLPTSGTSSPACRATTA